MKNLGAEGREGKGETGSLASDTSDLPTRRRGGMRGPTLAAHGATVRCWVGYVTMLRMLLRGH